MQQRYGSARFEQALLQIVCLRIAELREPRSWFVYSDSELTTVPWASQHRHFNPHTNISNVYSGVPELFLHYLRPRTAGTLARRAAHEAPSPWPRCLRCIASICQCPQARDGHRCPQPRGGDVNLEQECTRLQQYNASLHANAEMIHGGCDRDHRAEFEHWAMSAVTVLVQRRCALR